jgi:hypothetical protein
MLAANGLSVTQLLGGAPAEHITIKTTLMHVSGQYISSEVAIPQLQSKQMNNCQAAGASISYFRRYAYQAILGLSSDDNDAATPPVQQPAPPTFQQQQHGFQKR